MENNESLIEQLKLQQVIYNKLMFDMEKSIMENIKMYQTPAEKEAKEREQDLENIRKYLEND